MREDWLYRPTTDNTHVHDPGAIDRAFSVLFVCTSLAIELLLILSKNDICVGGPADQTKLINKAPPIQGK